MLIVLLFIDIAERLRALAVVCTRKNDTLTVRYSSICGEYGQQPNNLLKLSFIHDCI